MVLMEMWCCGNFELMNFLRMNSGAGDGLALRSASKSLERTWTKSMMLSVLDEEVLGIP